MTLDDMRRETAVPVILADERGTISHVNDRFVEAFGWSRGDLVGAPLLRIIPESMWDAHNLGFARYLRTEAGSILGRPLTLSLRKSDGTVTEVEHTIVAQKEGGAWCFGARILPR